MGSNFVYLYKKYGSLHKEELVMLLITAILAGFYLAFDNWGVQEVDVALGVSNFLLSAFAVVLILALMTIAQKLIGIQLGYKVQYEYSWIGLLVGFFVTAFSYGTIPFFLPGGSRFEMIKTARLGKFLPDYKYSELFFITSLAVLIPLIISIPFGALYIISEVEIFRHITIAGLLLAVFALIPAPKLERPKKWGMHGVTDLGLFKQLNGGTYGYDLFCFSMTAYLVLVAFTLVFVALVLIFQIFSIILSLILGLLAIWIYNVLYKYFQK